VSDPFTGVQARRPRPQGLNAEFYERAATGRLHLQQCADCGHFQHPPRQLCRACTSGALSWVPVEGIGALYSWTTTHFPFDPGWAPAIPYLTGVIELPQGVRLVAALSAEVTPHIGAAVRVALSRLDDDSVLLYLRSAE